MKRQFLSLAFIVSFSLVGAYGPQKLDKESSRLIGHISAKSMQEHLKYLSSDELEGRGTPSKGLDLAADYIAADFKKSGLEPVGDDGYFQTSEFKSRKGEVQKVRNVIGVLRGSDPVLKDSFVLVTAHYDHLGVNPYLTGDQIYNGANDDGSGTVSVMELAEAFGKMKNRPKRTIVFMTFYGEEKGLVGSRFYGKHPIFPIAQTIADVNLEQVGRTDDTEAPRVLGASMTGFDFSDIGTIFADAGKQVGISVTKHPKYSDMFFALSDNQALADLGVPAHTICVAYEYPDYHRLSDTYDKVDYDNMAKVDQMVALGLLKIANSTDEPHWNAENAKAARYLRAWQATHQGK